MPADEEEYEDEETEDEEDADEDDEVDGEDEEESEDEESEEEDGDAEEEEEEEEEEESEDEDEDEEEEDEEDEEEEGGGSAASAEAGTTYTVQYGDTLSKLAASAYGDKHAWKGIFAANRDVIGSNPNVIKAGQELWIPEEDEGEEEEGGTWYTVRSGDSLSKIAQREMGDGDRWNEIYDHNRDTIGGNPNLIKPGQQLWLPE